VSTIRVSNIKNESTSNGGISVDSSGHVTVDGQQMPTAGALTGRRLNINGAMQVSQRGTVNIAHDDAITSPYTLDRWRNIHANLDSYDCTVTQDSDAPSGFAKSLKVTTGTTESAVDADDILYFSYLFEGQDVQMLQNGTAGAKKVTVSFYVKTSQPGTYVVNLYKINATSRTISKTYTITTTDWEYVELTFDGDTAGGGINNDTSEGFRVSWVLIAGSDWTSTDSTSWIDFVTTAWAYGHTQNGMATNASATWQLSGVQVEVGEKATSFEHRSFGDELARCQRYYIDSRDGKPSSQFFIGQAINSSRIAASVSFTQPMRANPSATIYSPVSETAGSVALYNNTSVDVGSGFVGTTARFNGFYYVYGGSGLTTGLYYAFKYSADAEV